MEEEEEEEEVFAHLEIEEESNPKHKNNNNINEKEKEKREICSNGCGRPTNVCLCNQLPLQPFSTSTQLIILHHPHELRHKLATVPILTKCLLNCKTLIGRRLCRGASPLLDSLYNNASTSTSQSHRVIYLFPGTYSSPSIELNEWVSLNCSKDLILIVFDGTWKHAKEMVNASEPFLSKFASRVCLNYDVGVDGETIFDSELILRKEPFSGCMSTIEAVARSLRVVEEKKNGIEIEEKLISVLKAMVQFQASYLKPVKPRPKLLKKKNNNRKEKNGNGNGAMGQWGNDNDNDNGGE